jgi:hypothetical protein
VKPSSWSALLLIVVAVIILTCDIGIRPRSWRDIKIGDTNASLRARYPVLERKYLGLENYNRLVEPRLIGRWVTYISVEHGRIATKEQEYLIGPESDFIRLWEQIEVDPKRW